MSIDAKIRDIIIANGHIKIDDMMREVLSLNPKSYYKSVKNIGEQGDFITAPEISQLFGEIIALWAIEKWQQLGSPAKFALVELGGGQGKLMRDFLRTAKIVPEFYQAAELYLVEINPHFIKKQKANLQQYNKKITWLLSIKGIPDIPIILIANEFFDALPVKQYMKVKNKWFETTLVIDPLDAHIKYGKIELHRTLQSQFLLEHQDAQDGAIIEESVESLDIMRSISQKVSSFGGAGLIIDYGYDINTEFRTREQYNSTLQAIKNHQYHSVIGSMGEADLTAHVDFNALKAAAAEQGIKDQKISSQKDFLLNYGIELRLQSLKKAAMDAEKNILDRQVFRLISEQQMGYLFKVLEIGKKI